MVPNRQDSLEISGTLGNLRIQETFFSVLGKILEMKIF